MLQEQSRIYQRLLYLADLVLLSAGWLGAYVVRFHLLTAPEHIALARYLGFLPWVLLVSTTVFWLSGLYAPDRAQRLPLLIFSVAKAVGVGVLIITASLFSYRALYMSRLHLVLFALLTPALMILLRLVLFTLARRARQQGRNLKRVLIVGAGEVGKRLEHSFIQYPWIGMQVVGFLDDFKTGEPGVLGPTDAVAGIVDAYEARGEGIDYVYIAMPLSAAVRIENIVSDLSTRLTHVCLVPDLFQFNILNSRITHIDGLPVIHLMDEAPLEFRQFVKRMIDVAFSAAFLLAASPLMLLIALAVKLSSRGPVFYRQERMGLNGQRFDMLKFRSMPLGAETGTGPVWAKPGESRATPVGKWLRKTSLDELPQFINVLRGDMSVVGPRPERPVFIEDFKNHVPRYMLRHKAKAGITGWAQVNGWRGATSIEKRIEYDLYYIQHWSLRLDFKIMFMTLWKGFFNENAY